MIKRKIKLQIKNIINTNHRLSKENKYVVYTVLTGNYELLNEQEVPNRSSIDFICFTDNPELSSKSWQIVLINSVGLDPVRESRRIKILAHEFLNEYQASLYIDNTVRLKVDPVDIFNDYLKGDFVCLNHPWRNCIYDEAEVVIAMSADNELRVREQMDNYRNADYPEQAGLIAGTFLLRRHNSPVVIQAMKNWYYHVLRFSQRDQLSFNFIAWQAGFRTRP